MLFYVGPRPVLRGRNSNDNVNTFTGKVGEYSNWSLMNPDAPLKGMPNNDHTPGTGRHPHGLYNTRTFRGLEDRTQPLDSPGEGARLENHRWHPWENKSAGNAKVFKAGFGHEVGTPVAGQEHYGYADWIYDGVTKKPLSGTFGHGVRGPDAEGTANSFGRFNPFDYGAKGVTETPLEDAGQIEPDEYEYRTAKINQWQGVTSSKALNV